MPLPALSTIRGHALQVAQLGQLLRRGRVGHAYLFAGPNGVGRRAVAQAVLGRLACLHPPGHSADPCGHCRSCTALERGDHPDLQTVVRDGRDIKIEQIREMTGRLRFDPVLGACKGVIVDDCDRMGDAAANSLLKTLEEPPANTVFILLTSKLEAVIETIRSRCQLVRFGELPTADVAALLVQNGTDWATAEAAAAMSAGSMANAAAVADPSKLAVVDLIAQMALSLGERPALETAFWAERIAKARKEAKIDTATGEGGDDKPSGKGEMSRDDLAWAVDAMRSVLRDAMLTGCGVDPATLPNARHKPALLAMASRTDPAKIAEVIADFAELESVMVFSPNVRASWTALVTSAAQKLAG